MRDWTAPLTASLRRRIRRRGPVRVTVPVISPYTDRLRDAAMDGWSCHIITVELPAEDVV